MKTIIFRLFLVVAFCGKVSVGSAQWVAIPDNNFVSWLNSHGYSSCMNGNLMDTTCGAIVSDTSLIIYGTTIQDLNGIQYFDALKSLDCRSLQVQYLPTLPSLLIHLNCGNNFLSSLPSLPVGLTWLNCDDNFFTALPVLPLQLEYLECSGNQLSNLPALPTTLTTLKCEMNQLSNLPILPLSLEALICWNNQLIGLPVLPTGLISLECRGNLITNLPTLPVTLTDLYCSNNQLLNLPALPVSLINLDFSGNQISNLPSIPPALVTLSCSNNLLPSLPFLPSTLIFLVCSDNPLSTLPALPSNLNNLFCQDNQLTNLPTLPSTLTYLECNNNQLTSLPVLPPNLTWLECSNNLLTSLPELPQGLTALNPTNNQITCFPVLPTSLTNSNTFSLSGNPFMCLPNYVPAMKGTFYLSYPLCIDNDPVNNPNACTGLNGVFGYSYKDVNSNCLFDGSDDIIKNIAVDLFDSTNTLINTFYSLTNGAYNYILDTATYTVAIDTANKPYTAACLYPGIDSTFTLTAANLLAKNINFDIACNPGFDVGVQSVNTAGFVFPGLPHKLIVDAGDMSAWYGLSCAGGVSGTVVVSVSGPVTYDSIPANAQIPVNISNNVFTYNIADFGNLNSHAFAIYFITDTIAQLGGQVCVTVNVTPTAGDNDITNNAYTLYYTVGNSFDPNDKQVYPATVAPLYNGWFTYTIRFQNTGTAPALNIRVVDTLDNNLDLSTFEIINYSHANTSTLTNNIATFRFPAINLPDSTTDLEGSQGFLQYRVKPLANLPLGTQINNTAYIYFDYNAPVATNNAATNFTTSISNIQPPTSSLHLYPNPGKGIYHLQFTKGNSSTKIIEVLNALGEKIYSTRTKNIFETINLNSQPDGIYLLRVTGEANTLTRKIVKQ